MRDNKTIGIQIPLTYLPSKGVDLTKWSVIACDQYTSQPTYWQDVADYVGDAPSTLHLILPEVYLGTHEEASRVRSTQEKMKDYLASGILEQQDRLIYVERTVDGKMRRGIMLALDLEAYDFTPGSQSLIRATEGTILDRLPPRMRIREGASLELPHILVLIDDPEDRVIGSVEKQKSSLPVVYDFDLMQHGGHLCGRVIEQKGLENEVVENLLHLASPDVFYPKYGVSADKGVLLFAVGDGNHSLATAKSIWEKIKPRVGMNHPARYALVEIENIHDKGLEFAPIHRVLFNLGGDPLEKLREYFGDLLFVEEISNALNLKTRVNENEAGSHAFGLVTSSANYLCLVRNPSANLPVGTLQPVLDAWLKDNFAGAIDYVHGDEIVVELGKQAGNAGFYLPAMAKDELFRTVLNDGALPRKTFSMGEAHEKRFYLETRKITDNDLTQ